MSTRQVSKCKKYQETRGRKVSAQNVIWTRNSALSPPLNRVDIAKHRRLNTHQGDAMQNKKFSIGLNCRVATICGLLASAVITVGAAIVQTEGPTPSKHRYMKGGQSSGP